MCNFNKLHLPIEHTGEVNNIHPYLNYHNSKFSIIIIINIIMISNGTYVFPITFL